ncbi:hypothetical protein BS78_04G079300 [Paspalum vaginatum]|nr:hypothetical protein BS78_04G079300 [Paspalum vaginatum]
MAPSFMRSSLRPPPSSHGAPSWPSSMPAPTARCFSFLLPSQRRLFSPPTPPPWAAAAELLAGPASLARRPPSCSLSSLPMAPSYCFSSRRPSPSPLLSLPMAPSLRPYLPQTRRPSLFLLFHPHGASPCSPPHGAQPCFSLPLTLFPIDQPSPTAVLQI